MPISPGTAVTVIALPIALATACNSTSGWRTEVDGGANPADSSSAGREDGGDAVQNDGGKDSNGTATSEAGGPTRSYHLASAGAQFVPGSALVFDVLPADLATDVDAFAFHEEFHGLPWDEFETNQPPPREWAEVMDAHASQAAAAGKPIFLSMLIGREYLQDKTVIKNGRITRQTAWSARCYDFATATDGARKRTAYLRYVEWMVRRFSPRWVNVAVETNAFAVACERAWPAMAELINAAYDTVKTVKPDAVVFPSFVLAPLYGYGDCPSPKTRQTCYDERYRQIASLKRDRFAVSTYPYLDEAAGARGPAGVEADWFMAAARRDPARPERVVVAETGWNSTDIVATNMGACVTAQTATEADQRDYLRRLVTIASENDMDLVTWWSNRDLLVERVMTDCPCAFDAAWCGAVEGFRASGGSDPGKQFFGELLFKIWGTMGIRNFDGTPKPLTMAAWKAARALPLTP